MIKYPPKVRENELLQKIMQETPQKVALYLALHHPVDHKGRYLHYDAFRFRVPNGLDTELAWGVVKLARAHQLRPLFSIGEPAKVCKFMFTPTLQKALSETDRYATSAAFEWMSSQLGEEKHIEYLLNDLSDDEAISSSQLEGAATTSKVAKELLKRKRKPRTLDEKMIVGNYAMMKYAWKHRYKPLSLDLISAFHQIGTEGINDDAYHPGVFRNSDDIRVVDGDGDIVHTPPPQAGIESRLRTLVEWGNTCHHDADSSNYIHPLIKAISLHFAIGYEHPFRDGNGRVARALFYWYLFKNDYAAFRYIAISVLLKSAPVRYGKSYLYTETDNMDMTYFIDYQCSIILRAISKYKEEYKKTLKSIDEFNEWLWTSGVLKKLSEKQKVVFQVARNGSVPYFTISTVKDHLGCSYNTAASVLNGLVDRGLFKKKREGREWVFSIVDNEKMMSDSAELRPKH